MVEVEDVQVALSLRQPWAWLVLHGKDVENRRWNTSRRGPFLIHAARGMTRAEYAVAVAFAALADPSIVVPSFEELPRGGIVGRARVDSVLPPCADKVHLELPVSATCSHRWHIPSQYGFRLVDVEDLPFRQLKGSLGFFRVGPEARS